MKAGDEVDVRIAKGWKPATCLAVRGRQAVVEADLGDDRSCLRLLRLNRDGDPDGPGAPVGYLALPADWLDAIVTQSPGRWHGRPIGLRGRLPQPRALLATRAVGRLVLGD